MSNQDKIKVFAGIVIFITVVCLYANEFEYMTNTIDFSKLMIYSFIAGLLIAIFFIMKLIREVVLFEKFMIGMASIVLLAMLMPLFGSLSNRILGERTTQIKSFKLIEIEARSEQPYGILDSTLIQMDGHRSIVQLTDGTATFNLKKGLKYRQTTDSIFLPMRRGLWGFNYLDLNQR